MTGRVLCALLALCLVATALPAAAHEYRPTLLRFDAASDGAHSIVWKWDGLNPNGVSGELLTFDGCESVVTDASVADQRMTRIRLTCPDETLRIGLPRPVSELVIDARFDGQPTGIRRVRAAVDAIDSESFRPSDAAAGATGEPTISLAEWVWLGVEHILIGWDHLAFVLALTLLFARLRRLLLVITGFTIGHSLTLGLTTLGVIPPPSSAPVEATIALSIAYLAVELVRSDAARADFAAQTGVAISIGFGLIHGFGFAGVLGDLGLPAGREWVALLGFNVGVELGQVAFLAVILGALAVVRRASRGAAPVPNVLRYVAAYGLGSLGVFWTLQRAAPLVFATR